MASAAMDYLNAAVAGLDGAACGDLLIALGEVQAKLTAAHAALLYRFDAADAHDAERYGSSSAWLAAKAGLPKKAARAAVRQMRQLRERPLLGETLAAGASPTPPPSPSRTGPASSPPRCVRRPTGSCWRQRFHDALQLACAPQPRVSSPGPGRPVSRPEARRSVESRTADVPAAPAVLVPGAREALDVARVTVHGDDAAGGR